MLHLKIKNPINQFSDKNWISYWNCIINNIKINFKITYIYLLKPLQKYRLIICVYGVGVVAKCGGER